ncbi:disks large-associated protein 5 [Protopterus annectens]|uniref:disks large-associated protein 5 n=1 Tax=Protopterus annectens TaxID=7888 RepID=UPI001CFBE37F|nr:disks large-associated protein 5 [Protopterus annectens]
MLNDVEDVNKKYEKLVNLETSGWKPSLPQVQAKKLVKKKAVVGVSSKPGPSDGGRAAAKSRLAAIKASMKAKLKQEETTEASSERVENADMVVFDAGFFMVESPAKHFNGSTSKMHANISSGKCRPQTVTPRSISRTAKRSCIMSFASPINNPLQSTEITHTFTPLPMVNVGEQLERIVAEESECGNMRHCIQTNNECVAVNCQKSCLPAKLTSTEFNSCPSPMTAKVTDIMVNSADTVSSDVLMCSPEKESMLEKAPEQSDASLSVKQSNELQSLYSAGLSHTDTFPAASGDGIHSQLETHGNPTPLEMAGLNCITSPSNQNLALASTITDDLIVFSPVGTPFHP